MDSKSLIERIAAALDRTPDEVADYCSALASVIREAAASLDAVALPGFGTFTPVKTTEHIIPTPEGGRQLMPPSVNLEFEASNILKKHINHG